MVEFVEIKSKEIIETNEVMYDFEVAENHQYIANNYVVHNCITSSNTGIHYPMASLINEIFGIKNELAKTYDEKVLPKIVADGGIRNYNDVVKALALGADYVMIGSIFASLFESAALFAYRDVNDFICIDNIKDICKNNGKIEVTCLNGNKIIVDEIYKKFYGMASKDGQIDLYGKKNKTSEGITKYIKSTMHLHDWIENMIDYLKSAMSYVNIKNIKDINKSKVIIISNNTYNSINK